MIRVIPGLGLPLLITDEDPGQGEGIVGTFATRGEVIAAGFVEQDLLREVDHCFDQGVPLVQIMISESLLEA